MNEIVIKALVSLEDICRPKLDIQVKIIKIVISKPEIFQA
ncbi:hypothetical protein CCAN11_1800004 [Capnocytophaga canimorsus]|uniref:Uncharacterized protein n=1 Tax=Capnocytophaga canimorsus TaxID=28188 RepID=A0A0B7I9Y3_9FLAO|nr:hypothetical protein CCAN11_1800004 [Capnocytophaga canimorsus]